MSAFDHHPRLPRSARLLGAVALFSLCLPLLAPAQILPEPEPRSKSGFYIEPMFSTNVVAGDFDGESFLTDGVELFLMPKFANASGFGVSVGWKSEGGTFGLFYYSASHDVTYLGEPGSAGFTAWGLRFTRQLILRSPVQPFILMTINLPRIRVADGAATASTVGDAIFTGVGLDLGAGLMYHLTPRIFLRGGVVFRGLMIGWARGPEGVTKEIGDLGLDYWQTHYATVRFAGGTCFTVSTGYTF